MGQGMVIGATWTRHLGWVDLVTEFGSLSSSSSNLLINCVILASAGIEDSMECISVLEVIG